MYRATAARNVPAELLDLKPKDRLLPKAFETYSKTQKTSAAFFSKMSDIPTEADPVDYGFYVTIRVFIEVRKSPDFQSIVTELDERLFKYEEGHQRVLLKSKCPEVGGSSGKLPSVLLV
jgi:hypothetical protein